MKRERERESPFKKGHDWQIIWDEDVLPAQFPQHIYGTADRPGIVVWSDKERMVILVELTVGDESNFSDQVERKQARYNKELIPGLHGSRWKAQLFTAVEVRGCHTLQTRRAALPPAAESNEMSVGIAT